MSLRRNLTLGLVAAGLALGGFAAAHGIAEARPNRLVVMRFLVGYFDSDGRFVPTTSGGATDVDRDAILMFVFSGPIDMGPDMRATLALTLAEQAELAAAQAADPEFDPVEDGYEPGTIPRRQATDRSAYFVATGSISSTSILIGAPQTGGFHIKAPGQFFKVLRADGSARVIRNRVIFNPLYVPSTFDQPQEIDHNPQGLDADTLYEVHVNGGNRPNHLFGLVRNLDGDRMAEPFSTTFTTTNRYLQDFTGPKIR